ncbi:MAG TPA: cytochrome c [Bryobacteraceae bacterium]|nr:cytochrome c [Bryobacteraceae bacterium]
MRIERHHAAIRIAAVTALAFTAAGCRNDMQNQPKYIPLRPSEFFLDQRSARPLPEGSVARGHLRENTIFETGRGPDGQFVGAFPIPVTKELLQRGRERYNIYCSTCHDQLGNGLGMIVRRGYRRPPSFHIARLKTVPNGHIYDVITTGFGAMPDYAAQITPADRWAIVAYVRALQRSQSATAQDVPPEQMQKLRQPAQGEPQ